MAIPRFMVPNINVGATCTNCRWRHEKFTFKRCVSCRKQATKENYYPLHDVDDVA